MSTALAEHAAAIAAQQRTGRWTVWVQRAGEIELLIESDSRPHAALDLVRIDADSAAAIQPFNRDWLQDTARPAAAEGQPIGALVTVLNQDGSWARWANIAAVSYTLPAGPPLLLLGHLIDARLPGPDTEVLVRWLRDAAERNDTHAAKLLDLVASNPRRALAALHIAEFGAEHASWFGRRASWHSTISDTRPGRWEQRIAEICAQLQRDQGRDTPGTSGNGGGEAPGLNVSIA